MFGHDANNLNYQLLLRVVFDPAKNNGTVTQIGNYSFIDDISLVAGEFSIYDSKRNMLWLAGEYGNDTDNFTINYFYIDAKTGTNCFNIFRNSKLFLLWIVFDKI